MARTTASTAPAKATRGDNLIGSLQPEGLFVSPLVLDGGALPKLDRQVQADLVAHTPDARLADAEALVALLTQHLGWHPRTLVDLRPTPHADLPKPLALPLPEGGTVRPQWRVQARSGHTLALVQWTQATGADALDRAATPGEADDVGASLATRQSLHERLLRHHAAAHKGDGTHVLPLGLYAWPDGLRLTYAPAGQAPGHVTFVFEHLHTTDGRLLVDGLHALLGKAAWFTAHESARLPALLAASRDAQAKVTNDLAAQVEDALRELLAGMDVANGLRDGGVYRNLPADVHERDRTLYDGLTTVLLRLVFLLYAEDYGLLPMDHPLYAQHHSVSELARQLEATHLTIGDAMDQHHGAWSRLLVLFRLLHGGVFYKDAHAPSGRALRLPARKGDLFDPDTYPFLEGRPHGSQAATDPAKPPPVSDGTVHRVLDRLRNLHGNRVSYKALEVEQLGSVYEALMGFEVRRAAGPTMCVRVSNKAVHHVDLAHLQQPIDADGEPLQRTLYLADVLGERPAKLRKLLPTIDTWTPCGIQRKDEDDLRGLLAPLTDKVTARRTSVGPGQHYLQPGAARRSSGSHYTPRSLTQPLVHRTVHPLLYGDDGTQGPPTAQQVLALRVCDPAVGSGAFLAETCRQLADELVAAWGREGLPHDLPMDAQQQAQARPVLYARRRVAEQCLYGVDKNPRAVQLARLSLWLITSAKDLPFTFLDHNIKCGDALIGLSPRQVAEVTMAPRGAGPSQLHHITTDDLRTSFTQAASTRAKITARGEQRFTFNDQVTNQQISLLKLANDEVWDERRVADTIVAKALADLEDKPRKKARDEGWQVLADDLKRFYPADTGATLRAPTQGLYDRMRGSGLRPFHWWLEFPEVFEGRVRDQLDTSAALPKKGTKKRAAWDAQRQGFDAIVGNPPFGGETTINSSNGVHYIDLLHQLNPHAHGKSDLAAYFFLQAHRLLRTRGTLGLVASNTIAQGVTRDTGLRHLVKLPSARRVTLTAALVDLNWPVPGAAVVVDCINAIKAQIWDGPVLHGTGFADGLTAVESLNSGLQPGPELAAPVKLGINAAKCFSGHKVAGQGFIVDIPTAHRLLDERPDRAEVLRPYLGGKELNSNVPATVDGPIPVDRYVIHFGTRSLKEAEQWPVLLEQVRRLVKPERDQVRRQRHRDFWWLYGDYRKGLEAAAASASHHLCASQVSKHLLWGACPTTYVFAHTLNVLPVQPTSATAALSSQVHDRWARALGSSMKNDLRYTASTCFETFPFPPPSAALEALGHTLHRRRAECMIARQQGMTATWNLVHDPHCRDEDIHALREARDALDAAVLAAYGWSDLDPAHPDFDREVVLRLRLLNTERAAAEAQQAAEQAKATTSSRTRRKPKA